MWTTQMMKDGSALKMINHRNFKISASTKTATETDII